MAAEAATPRKEFVADNGLGLAAQLAYALVLALLTEPESASVRCSHVPLHQKETAVLVHIVADYGHGDLAFSEVIQRIRIHLPDAELVLTPVPAFSTLAAGFCIAQLGLNEAPPGTLIYHNVAPRADDAEARPGNAGERLSYARLSTGVRVIGVHAGHTLSFIRDEAEKLRWAAIPAAGSQFRSRDLFPQAAAAIALGVAGALGEEIDAADVPDIPMHRIAYIDGYGNLKTTVLCDSARLRPDTARVNIGGITREALVSDGSFAVPHGQTAFAPGSSGWQRDGMEQCAGWKYSCEAGTPGKPSDVRRSELRSESISSEVGDWLAATAGWKP